MECGSFYWDGAPFGLPLQPTSYHRVEVSHERSSLPGLNESCEVSPGPLPFEQKIDRIVVLLHEHKEETADLKKEIQNLKNEVTLLKQCQSVSCSSSSSNSERKRIPSELSVSSSKFYI